MLRYGKKVFLIKFWLAVCCVVLGTINFAFLIYDFAADPKHIWFHGLDYFTTQTNLMTLAFGICYLINIKHKFLTSARWMNFVGAYVIGMFVIYNAILLPSNIANGETTIYWIESVLRHELVPLCFVTWCVFCGKFKQWDKPVGLWKTTLQGMYYPLGYSIYALFIPLASTATDDRSVYGSFSNVWYKYGQGGGPSNLIYIFVSLGLFLGALILCWFILNVWLIKKIPNQTKN
jgi:hypothetical protein